jgi:hypothetical protein
LWQLIHNEFLVTKGSEGKETGLMEKINRQCFETNGHFVDNSETKLKNLSLSLKLMINNNTWDNSHYM